MIAVGEEIGRDRSSEDPHRKHALAVNAPFATASDESRSARIGPHDRRWCIHQYFVLLQSVMIDVISLFSSFRIFSHLDQYKCPVFTNI